MSEMNEELIEFTNKLTVEDVRFIMYVWKDRLSIWNPNTRRQDNVENIWLNGTAIELGIAKEQEQPDDEPWPNPLNLDLDQIKLK